MAGFRVTGFGAIVTGVCVAGVVSVSDAHAAGGDAHAGVFQVAVVARSGGEAAFRGGLRRHRNFGVSQLGDDIGGHGADKRAGPGVVRPGFVAPRFSAVEIQRDGGARLAGTCSPRSSVRLDVDGRHREAIACDRDGRFDTQIGHRLGVGDHLLAMTAVSRSGHEWVGQDVRVSIPKNYRVKLNPAQRWRWTAGEGTISKDLRSLAEDLARAASDRFGELTTKTESGNTQTPSNTQAPSHTQAPLERPKARARGVRIAGGDDSGSGVSHPTGASGDGTGSWVSESLGSGPATVGGWVARSGEAYDTEIVPKLSVPGPSAAGSPVAAISQRDVPLPARGTRSRGFAPVRVELGRYVDALSHWLERSHKDYQTHVARPLSYPKGGEPGPVVVARDGFEDATTPIDQPRTVGVVSPPVGRLASPELEAQSRARSQAEAARLAAQFKNLEEAHPQVRKQSAQQLKLKRDTALRLERKAKAESQARQAALKAVTELNERLERERVERLRRAEESRLAALTQAEAVAREKRALAEANKRALQKELEARQVMLEARRKVEAAREARDKAVRAEQEKAAAPARVAKAVPPGRARSDSIAVRNPNLPDDVSDSARDDVAVRARATKKSKRVSRKRIAKARSKSVKRGRRAKSKKRRVRVARGTAVKAYRKRKRVKKKRRRRRARSSRTYVVRRGDTLWDIARRHYGDGRRYTLLHKANRGKIRDPNKIWPRQKICLPRVKR